MPVPPSSSKIHGHRPSATLESLYRIFTIPEGEDSTLGRIDQEISRNLAGFLKDHVVSKEMPPSELERDFLDAHIPDDPIYVSEQADFLLSKVVAQSVHVSSPSFVGHMTSALPYFMLPLAKIMIALNQNLVKIETSKAFTPLERQVIGMMHHLVYQRENGYYEKFTQDASSALGVFCSDGTLANLTALWVALNHVFPPTKTFDGIGDEGLFAAMQTYGYQGLAILVSKRGHYSLKKAANILGIGRKNLIAIDTDDHNKIKISALEEKIRTLRAQKIAVVAVVGIAGTTETGNVDPLPEMAKVCAREKIHFHVDAAWGGPTLFSDQYRHLLHGIDQADSVTIDAHKQLYVPVGAGIALFRDEKALRLIEHQAQYIIRRGSRDLGKMTLEGSRPGIAMLVHSGLRIIGRKGYEMLINLGIEKARAFADLIRQQPDFELITEPELNLLTYRYVPAAEREALMKASPEDRRRINEHLNRLTINLQKEQREEGRTFVSRTALEPARYDGQLINVFRVVLANPLTTEQHLKEVLDDQRMIAHRMFATDEPYSREL